MHLHRAIKKIHMGIYKRKKTYLKRNSDQTGMDFCTRGFNKNKGKFPPHF